VWPFRRRSAPEPPLVTGYRDSPDAKAARLLWSKLTAAQRATFGSGYFDVTGSRGGWYRIYTHTTTQNIIQPGFIRDSEWCVGPATPMPRYDRLLCQKVLIESDEERFMQTACLVVRRYNH